MVCLLPLVIEFGRSHWPRVMAAGFVKYTSVSLVSLVLVMSSTGYVVGGRERGIDDRGEILDKLNKEKIRMETCCITDVDVVVNSLPNSR